MNDILNERELHAISNGNLICYIANGNIQALYGPVFSVPKLLEMKIIDKNLEIRTQRINKSMVWKIELFDGGKNVGCFYDYVLQDKNVFVREFQLDRDVSFNCFFHEKTISNKDFYFVPKDTLVYSINVSPFACYFSLSLENCQMVGDNLILHKGKGKIIICTEKSQNQLKTLENSDKDSKESVIAYWQNKYAITEKFLRNKIDYNKYGKIYEDVYFCIMSQASQCGGGMAGSKYNMSYVRDQFGVFKGYCVLGLYDKAKGLLQYYWRIYQQYGKIHNAQTMGYMGGFHIHENDLVEITGYLVLQARDYLKYTGDKDFVLEMLPMLKWAMQVQKSQLHNSMLPFNGDETYIAGSIVPRTVLDDGASESTLLFAESCKWFSSFMSEINEVGLSEEYSKIYCEIMASYRNNFFDGNRFLANNPKRRIGLTKATMRYGVCANCISVKQLKLVDECCYICSECAEKIQIREVKEKLNAYRNKYMLEERYEIPLLYLYPEYIGSDLFDKKQLKEICQLLKQAFIKTGEINPKERTSVGYQYGEFLILLSKTEDDFADEIYEKLLSLREVNGTWAEYYCDGLPFNTYYRPWESAINLYAIDIYLKGNKKTPCN